MILMRLQVQLVHVEAGVRVVLVSAWSGADCLGSALGEASDAEEAERRAETRLRQRLAEEQRSQAPAPDHRGQADDTSASAAVSSGTPAVIRPSQRSSTRPEFSSPPSPSRPERGQPSRSDSVQPTLQPTLQTSQQASALEPLPPPAADTNQGAMAPNPSSSIQPIVRSLPAEPPQAAPAEESLQDPPTKAVGAAPDTNAPIKPEPSAEPNTDPEDWSDDLARIDLEVQRLGWSRSQEAVYLERAFGHPSRSRLTRYGDLVAYLQALGGLEPGADPSLGALPLRRRDLLEQCDELLGLLGWDPDQGRLFLELNFQCSSRQHLSDSQLLQFNMQLEEQWIQQSRAPAT